MRRAAANRERQGEHHLTMLIAAALAAALVAMSVLSTSGDLTLRVVVSVALGLILVTMRLAANWVVDHAENWHCAKLRRASGRASRYRQAAAAAAAHDEADAEAAWPPGNRWLWRNASSRTRERRRAKPGLLTASPPRARSPPPSEDRRAGSGGRGRRPAAQLDSWPGRLDHIGPEWVTEVRAELLKALIIVTTSSRAWRATRSATRKANIRSWKKRQPPPEAVSRCVSSSAL